MRSASVTRKTNETDIAVDLLLDGEGKADIHTGIGFFDHMLDQVARHSLINLTVRAKGDLHIDQHHTVEDVGIALGQALTKALGDKRGIVRYADCLLPILYANKRPFDKPVDKDTPRNNHSEKK